MSSQSPRPIDALIHLSHVLAEPRRELVVLAEGNTSLRTAPDRMLVKATGCSLAGATEEDFVEVDLDRIHALLADDTAGDDVVATALDRARLAGTKRASVEALLHAVCQSIDGVQAVGHTHPTAVNSLLCSQRADALVAGALFPDQIVVLGTDPLLVDYHDPGLTLARAVDARLREHVAGTGRPPKVIYLRNHGMFALGADVEEVVRITEMADKVARVLLGALGAGGPVYLDRHHVERIDSRPDEQHRRAVLQAAARTARSAS